MYSLVARVKEILLVEDEPTNLEFAAAALRRHLFTTGTAHDGSEVVAAVSLSRRPAIRRCRRGQHSAPRERRRRACSAADGGAHAARAAEHRHRDVERVLGAGVAGVPSRPNTGAQLRDAIATICYDSAWSTEGVLPFGTGLGAGVVDACGCVFVYCVRAWACVCEMCKCVFLCARACFCCAVMCTLLLRAVGSSRARALRSFENVPVPQCQRIPLHTRRAREGQLALCWFHENTTCEHFRP